MNKEKIEIGDKVMYASINIDDDTLSVINEQQTKRLQKSITKEDVQNYPKQVWLLENKCPICGSDLMGLFGSFKWDLRHGIGFCSECNKINFQFYHYIKDFRFEAFSVIEF